MHKKSYTKNYSEINGNIQLVLPLNLENLIPEDDSVLLLSHVLEELNYKKLYKAYSSVGRKPAVEPKIMFKIISHAYSQNIYSSRKIEKACRRDINFRWLLQEHKTPDHATISRFRKDYLSNEVIEDLFYQQVKYLAAHKEILFENVFIDGTKIEANANRYTFVWKKAIYKNEEKMLNKIITLIRDINIQELREFIIQKETVNDIATLIPMLNNMQEKIGRKYLNIIADSGYESEENYLFIEANTQIPYIKPQTYEKWKKRSFKNDISKRENMKYDAELDIYTCHNGKKLAPTSIIHRKSASGYKAEVTVYECESCDNCTHKAKCTKAKGNRKMQVSKTFVEKREISYKNITSKMGTKLRMNRSIQVEGAFGVLKSDYEFTRFLTRGKNSVKTEFILLCFGYNINKLHSKIQNQRTQNHLHELKSTA